MQQSPFLLGSSVEGKLQRSRALSFLLWQGWRVAGSLCQLSAPTSELLQMLLPLWDVGLIPLLGLWLMPCAVPVSLVLPALLLEGLTHSRAAAFSNQGPFDLSLGSKAQSKGFKGCLCSTVWLVSCPSAVVLRRCCTNV